MAILITAKQPTSMVDAGTYNVTCTNLIADTIPESKFNPEIYRFYFEVDGVFDEDGTPALIDAISSRTFSPKSKLWSWLVAFGLKPEVGVELDIEQVVGRSVMAVVTPTDDGLFNRVSSLVPLPKGKAPPQKAQEAPSEDATPFDTDDAVPDSLDAWTAKLRSIGYRPVEIRDHARAAYDRDPADLTAIEREELAKSLGV